MTRMTYQCPRCGCTHDLSAPEGARHLKYAMDADQLAKALDFTATAGANAYIFEHTQQYVRDTQVFGVLQDKFSNSGMFANRDAALAWLHERLAVNPDNVDQILRRLQGDGAGEVDALRQISDDLRNLFYRTEFVRDATGHIPSNTPGIDLQSVNRFTGDHVVEELDETVARSQDLKAAADHVLGFYKDCDEKPPKIPELAEVRKPKQLRAGARTAALKSPKASASRTSPTATGTSGARRSRRRG